MNKFEKESNDAGFLPLVKTALDAALRQ